MVAVTASPHMEAIPGWHAHQCSFERVIASESTKRIPIFVAPFRCELGEVALINSTAVSGRATNYVNFNLINGGAEGAGTTELAARDLASGTDLDAGKTLLLDATSSGEVFLSAGDILELESEEAGNGLAADINQLSVYVAFRPANLSS